MCRELVAEVLNIFKILCDIFFFSPKYWQTHRKTVARLLYDYHVTVVNLSRQIVGKFTLRKFFETLL